MRQCNHCGHETENPTARFCAACGSPLASDAAAPDRQPSTETPVSSNTAPLPNLKDGAPPETEPRKKRLWGRKRVPNSVPKGRRFSFRRLFRRTVLVLFLAGAAYYGVLFLLEKEHEWGLIDGFRLQKALNEWKQDKDAAAQEQPLLEAVAALAASVEAGDLQGALGQVIPERQDLVRKDLEAVFQDAASRTAMAQALRSGKVTFISAGDRNPDEARFRAQVEVPVGDLTHTMTFVLKDEKWMVSRL